jgi:tetratricopeptide (TPR) repeat protein
VLARSALARGDVALAAADAAGLPASRDRLALDAGLAAARGDSAEAVRDYFAAGDLQGMEQHIDALASAGRIEDAVTLERAVVERLATDPTQQDALAQALFDLGRIDQTLAYQFPLGDPRRHLHEVEAVEPYARAVALAPLDERYLLAYANGELNAGDVRAAERVFERARDADPTSAEPIAGLGDAAFRRGDVAAARAYLARARALDPASAAVGTLARKLGL